MATAVLSLLVAAAAALIGVAQAQAPLKCEAVLKGWSYLPAAVSSRACRRRDRPQAKPNILNHHCHTTAPPQPLGHPCDARSRTGTNAQ